MSVVACPIIRRKFATVARRGRGAHRFGAARILLAMRQASTRQSLALAALEVLMHVDSEKLLPDYVTIPVTIDQHLITDTSA